LVSKSLFRSTRDKIHLSPGSIYMLRLIYKNEMMTMSEISMKLSIPKPNVTAMVDRLITENMIERVYDSKDRRIINIRLTDKGREDIVNIKRTIGKEMRERIEVLGEERIRLMMDSTQYVRDTLAEIMNDFYSADCKLGK
jgi:DNA-binding MarR family transcriptional regulator